MSEESRPKKQSATQIIEVRCRIQLAKPQVRMSCEKDNKLEKTSNNTSIYLTPPSKSKPVPNSHKSGSDANNVNAPFESLVPLTELQQVTTVVCMLFYRRENATNRQKQLPIEANANRTLREVIREAFIKSRVPILPDTLGRVYKSERGFGKGHELSSE
ncbi:hypothetical protein WR25_23200 [Diploscapter pachys]|uniref:Uncharacterized protein n=1 Tax=Diploscapter pachys TaxID=2018661 RepID=A0A2A2K0B3_9BILA|nr:hypothetical protein WR25_23200 [Diploscapter pachys]